MPINRNILKSYAPQARREFIQAVTDRASVLGLSEKKIEPVEVKGDVAIIAGRPFPKDVAASRNKLVDRITLNGFTQVMEEVAYTWFNRFTALRYMELHDYLGHGYRVLSNPGGSDIPEILEKATIVDLPGLDKDKVAALRLAGDKDAELYQMLLIKQCNALHRVMPALFEAVNDATELLLPHNLLQTISPIRKLVNDIPEENWSEIEIVGWLYQFYIIERRKEVFGTVVESKDIPAATQLFTPNWIVKYMVQNTLGRKWLTTYPASGIKGKMEFYIEPAEQEPEVQAKLDAITPKELDPEELTFMDPACGSGHILAEAYDLFKGIYLERGYRTRDIPRLILEKNLYGLDIDDRAAQLARFTVLMKARADDRRILDPEKPVRLNIMAIQESKGLEVDEVARVLLRERVKEIGGKGAQQLTLVQPTMSQTSLSTSEKPDVTKEELFSLLHLFKDGKTFGSLLTVHDRLKAALSRLEKLVAKALTASDMESRRWGEALLPFVKQTRLLAVQYDFVVANPPYMGSKGLNPTLKRFAKYEYPNTKSDLFAMFIECCLEITKEDSSLALITMQSWMFLSSYENFRIEILSSYPLHSMLHLGPGIFDHWEKKISQHTCFVFLKIETPGYKGPFYSLVDGRDESSKRELFLRRKNNPCFASASDFKKIPGSPIAYWACKNSLDAFQKGVFLYQTGHARKGLVTLNDEKWIRMWYEVSIDSIFFEANNRDEAVGSCRKWFPLLKGGGFRRWHGNNMQVINWQNDGKDLKDSIIEKYSGGSYTKEIRSEEYYFKPAVSWTKVSSGIFSARINRKGALLGDASCCFYTDKYKIEVIASLLNSFVADHFLQFLAPTLNYKSGDIEKLPLIVPENEEIDTISDLCSQIEEIGKDDWNSQETSWGYSKDPLVFINKQSCTISCSYDCLCAGYLQTLEKAKSIESRLNHIWSKTYQIFPPNEVGFAEDNLSLNCNPHYIYGPGKSKYIYIQLFKTDVTIRLISYSIGCIMGRYSLDDPGLIYAHGGNEGFNPSCYTTFPADEDGIVPVMDDDWFEDDATKRFAEFLKVTWSPETLDENLKFVADSLEPKHGEKPLDTIRRFISHKFFKDHHLKVYKKRPIYWLFSSGRHKAFQCLVYLHRYTENTLARMRAMYVTPLQGKFNARIEYMEKEIPAASSTSAAKKLQKELETMRKKQQELCEFDEILRHYADQRISLDLDDGVKVNYGKFGSLLAEVKAITGDSGD